LRVRANAYAKSAQIVAPIVKRAFLTLCCIYSNTIQAYGTIWFHQLNSTWTYRYKMCPDASLEAEKAQVDAHAKVREPVLLRREFLLEHPIVMCFTDPAVTQVANAARRIAQGHGFDGVTLFFPE